MAVSPPCPPRANLPPPGSRGELGRCRFHPEQQPLCPILRLGDVVRLAGQDFPTLAATVSCGARGQRGWGVGGGDAGVWGVGTGGCGTWGRGDVGHGGRDMGCGDVRRGDMGMWDMRT